MAGNYYQGSGARATDATRLDRPLREGRGDPTFCLAMTDKKAAKLSQTDVDTFVGAHEQWRTDGDALERTFTFENFGASVAFAVNVGFVADQRDHHPDLNISWGKVGVRWTTHDAGGITALDVEMAQVCEHVYDT
jgi:4a-hydroxytetrahydrobiopterin dehydratase